MIQKLVFIKFILLVFVTFTFQKTVAQEHKKETIPLAVLLDKISGKHKIFFTYNANLISDKYIQEEGFVNLSLEESISLLEKITPFLFDDLGNSYYVIYAKKQYSKRRIHSKGNTIYNEPSASVDSVLNNSKITVRGMF